MKLYKVTLAIIDLEHMGPGDIASILENTRYANNCISPQVVDVDTYDIGEWSDGHILNQTTLLTERLRELFATKPENH